MSLVYKVHKVVPKAFSKEVLRTCGKSS